MGLLGGSKSKISKSLLEKWSGASPYPTTKWRIFYYVPHPTMVRTILVIVRFKVSIFPKEGSKNNPPPLQTLGQDCHVWICALYRMHPKICCKVKKGWKGVWGWPPAKNNDLIDLFVFSSFQKIIVKLLFCSFCGLFRPYIEPGREDGYPTRSLATPLLTFYTY